MSGATSGDAPPGVSRSVRGLLRAARAIDSLLERIHTDLSDGLLPQKAELLAALTFESSTEDSIRHYAYDEILSMGEWEGVELTFAGVTLQLAQLEDTLVDLRRAVTWSSRFAAFNWWMIRRQRELGATDLIVIAGPGSCREFLIEPRSGLADQFTKVRTILNLGDTAIANLNRIRILTVPQSDGASARWHPVGLGHELGHLCFTQQWLREWLAKRTPSEESRKTVAIAAAWLEGTKPAADRWWHVLCSWLVETACDAVTLHYYGDAGFEALATFLAVHSTSEDGDQHPAPAMRLAALKAVDAADLDEFRSNDTEQLGVTERKNAYCDLAVAVRAEVYRLLSEDEVNAVDAEGRTAVLETTVEALQNDSAPSARAWDPVWVRHRPATIEAGLVNALWRHTAADLATTPADDVATAVTENRVEHAIDFLQFFHRFEHQRHRLNVEVPDDDDDLTNVLHITSRGIRYDALDEPGRSTHDVRLGRHFIVFKRNRIPALDLVNSRETRRVQDSFEIGWGEDFVLHPGEMVLAVTLESIQVDSDCTAQVLSRSSLGRMGLLSATAVQVQPGFRGCLTLELVNLASVPLKLTPGQRVAQIVPAAVIGAHRPYTGKYQDQSWKPRFSEGNTDWELDVLGHLKEDAESGRGPEHPATAAAVADAAPLGQADGGTDTTEAGDDRGRGA